MFFFIYKILRKFKMSLNRSVHQISCASSYSTRSFLVECNPLNHRAKRQSHLEWLVSCEHIKYSYWFSNTHARTVHLNSVRRFNSRWSSVMSSELVLPQMKLRQKYLPKFTWSNTCFLFVLFTVKTQTFELEGNNSACFWCLFVAFNLR